MGVYCGEGQRMANLCYSDLYPDLKTDPDIAHDPDKDFDPDLELVLILKFTWTLNFPLL